MSHNRFDLESFLPYRLSFTGNLVSEAIAGAYKSLFGLSIPEWRVVAHIAQHPRITQQEIVGRTRMDKVAVSRAAVALMKRGVIARMPNDQDRRSHHLILTASGRELFAAIAPKALELEAAIFGRMSAAERAAFTAILQRIDESVFALQQGEGDKPAGGEA